MKKIINGKKYNTETAKELGYWENEYSISDFRYCTETLYKKRTGEFFLYGEGGAMTGYAKRCEDDSWCGGEDITPLTLEGAKKWAERHLTADKYIEIFGEVEE